MDDFTQAEIDDYLLDRADDFALRTQIWDDLHGEYRDFVSFYEACADQGRDRAEASREWPTPDDVLRITGRGGENLHG